MAAAAIVLAAVAGIGVYLYASNADKRAEQNAHFVSALVANSDIAKGTTGREALQAGLIDREQVARGSIPPSIVTNVNTLLDKVAASRIDAKQFITAETFVGLDEGLAGNFANAITKGNNVAVSVNVDMEKGVANQIAPGDHVNIAWEAAAAPDQQPTWSYLLEDVKVLAVGPATVQQQVAQSGDGTTSVPVTGQVGLLTLEVTPDDALRVMTANTSAGKIYLALLPPAAEQASGSGGKTTATASR
jgi:Flp pilus assembly protein CpaB